MKKILVLGYFGYVTDQLDGQTVKTRNIYRLATEQCGKEQVEYFDTQEFKRNRLSLFKMFRMVTRTDILLYLPAHNNLRVLFPIIYCLSIVHQVTFHYFVVGGWLKEFLAHLPVHRAMLKRISGIHVETQWLKNELEEYYHFENVDVFPNFRFFNFIPQPSESEKLRVVFMARITRQKGLDWVFAFADYIVENSLQEKYSITFYGPEADADKSYFEKKVAGYEFVDYRGALQPSEIYETLSQYDVMLLPTHFYTEGLPGSIVDAYIAGIPVIVTEWKYSHEFVDDGINGYIVPFENGIMQMIDRLLTLERDRAHLQQFKANARVKRMEFAPPKLEAIIVREAALK